MCTARTNQLEPLNRRTRKNLGSSWYVVGHENIPIIDKIYAHKYLNFMVRCKGQFHGVASLILILITLSEEITDCWTLQKFKHGHEVHISILGLVVDPMYISEHGMKIDSHHFRLASFSEFDTG